MKKTANKFTVRPERWNVAADRSTPSQRKVVTKVAVRNKLGQFHGATNFVGSVIK